LIGLFILVPKISKIIEVQHTGSENLKIDFTRASRLRFRLLTVTRFRLWDVTEPITEVGYG